MDFVSPSDIDPAALPGEGADVPDPAPAPASAAKRSPKLQERVLVALKEHVVPALPADLAQMLAVDEKSLKRLLGKMARDGSVRRSGGGRFTGSRHYK